MDSQPRQALIEVRRKRHWTQAEAAEKIGCDFKTLSRWELGTQSPSDYYVKQLCKTYGTTAAELNLEDARGVSLLLPEDAGDFMDLTMALLNLAYMPHRHFLEIQDRLATTIEEYTAMNTRDAQVTRRDALRRLAGFPLISLKLSSAHPVLNRHPEEIISHCAASVAACWELSRSKDGDDLALAFKGASAYLPTLKAIVKESSQYRQAAASLAGQCLLLKMLIGWHTEGHHKASQYAQEAIFYSKEANDNTLWLAVLDYASWMHYYDRASGPLALRTAEETMPLLKDKGTIPPRLASGLYSTLAVMQAKEGQKATATLQKAADAFFASGGPEEHRFLYMDYTQSELILNDGMVKYYQGDYSDALASFGQLMDENTFALQRRLPERTKVEMLNLMAMSALKSKDRDIDKALHFWEPAITGAKALQSEQRFSETLMTYDIMEALWPGDKRIVSLRDLTRHW